MQEERNELLQIVDKNDIEIGAEIRSIVHKKKIFHRSIHVLIFNMEGKLFLQKRGQMKDESPGLWACSVSGHVDYGETYDEACLREIEEEVGIKLTTLPEKIFKLEASEITGNEFSWIYAMITEQELTPRPIEIEIGQWFTLEELEHFISVNISNVAPLFIHIWRKYNQLKTKSE